MPVAVGGGSSPHRMSTRRSAETTAFACTSNAASVRRSLALPRLATRPATSTSSGPSARNVTPYRVPPPPDRPTPAVTGIAAICRWRHAARQRGRHRHAASARPSRPRTLGPSSLSGLADRGERHEQSKPPSGMLGVALFAAVIALTSVTGSSVLARSELFAGRARRRARRRLLATLATARPMPRLLGPADGGASASPAWWRRQDRETRSRWATKPGLCRASRTSSTGPTPQQQLDLYLLRRSLRRCWCTSTRADGWPASARTSCRRSCARCAVDTRSPRSSTASPRTSVFPVPLQDAKTAVRWIKAHGPEFGLRTDKVFATGASAGGHLAAMVATTPGLFEPMDLSPDSPGRTHGSWRRGFARRSARPRCARREVGHVGSGARFEFARLPGPRQ